MLNIKNRIIQFLFKNDILGINLDLKRILIFKFERLNDTDFAVFYRLKDNNTPDELSSSEILKIHTNILLPHLTPKKEAAYSALVSSSENENKVKVNPPKFDMYFKLYYNAFQLLNIFIRSYESDIN